MKSTNKQGFTLVELIIVITILAILATIAFISFQGYSADARDSRVKAEITNALKVMTAEQAKGAPISVYVTPNPNLQLTGVVSVQGSGALNYTAGLLNKAVLGLDSENNYAMGFVSNFGGSYQLAGRLSAEGKFSYVAGNYNPRTNSGALSASGTAVSGVNTINLTNNLGRIKLGDTISGTGIPANTTVIKVSPDLATLTISNNTSASVTSVSVAALETAGLIRNDATPAGPTVNGGAHYHANF